MCLFSFYIIFNVQYVPLLAAIGHIMSKKFHHKWWWQAGRQADSWNSKIDLIYLKFLVDPFLTPRCISTPWIIPSTPRGWYRPLWEPLIYRNKIFNIRPTTYDFIVTAGVYHLIWTRTTFWRAALGETDCRGVFNLNKFHKIINASVQFILLL